MTFDKNQDDKKCKRHKNGDDNEQTLTILLRSIVQQVQKVNRISFVCKSGTFHLNGDIDK
ncbi:hypothetical protein T4D_15160 [Trichinella pseudospiralis]|uniref:Uncharacterized protein n=1 Tax=Trichinella pseudospiralis TaxID=6337 RepID=A0A0V1FEH8_TRIPS|nr:hypothetical protein T4D_15160 [Trichinella pseudospiralis]